MKKIFIAGDYISGTGPANVTKSLIQNNNSYISFQKTRNKLFRAAEIFYRTLCADAVLYSSYSLQNLLGFAIAKFFHRPSFYLMHANIEYENAINRQYLPNMAEKEAAMLKNVDYILAVSLPFEYWLKNKYPQYSHKIYTLVNGIDWDKMNSNIYSQSKISGQILSIGGGLPIKNILSVCKAIEQIYQNNAECSIKLVVLGSNGDDSDAIRSYPFVEDRGLVSHEEALLYMASSQLYIQNSLFETFGLAPIEALLQGCDLLISAYAGAISIISAIQEEDRIDNPENIEELQRKILFILQNSNAKRLLNSIDRDSTSVIHRQKELNELVEHLL